MSLENVPEVGGTFIGRVNLSGNDDSSLPNWSHLEHSNPMNGTYISVGFSFVTMGL